MKIETIVVGSYQTNCYVVSSDNQAIIIDPGDEFYKIKQVIGDRKVCAILLTHRHFDHVGALQDCIHAYHVQIYDKDNLQEQAYQLGPFHVQVIYNPGHTRDSVSYYISELNSLFTGDFIFKQSIGRVDLGGSVVAMRKSIQQFIHKKWNPNIVIYPGHGPTTTIGEELQENPYLKEKENDLF